MRFQQIFIGLNLLIDHQVHGGLVNIPELSHSTASNTLYSQKATESTNTMVFPVTHEQLVNKIKDSKQIQEQVKKQYGSSSSIMFSPSNPEPHPRKLGHVSQKEVVVPVPPPIQNPDTQGEITSMAPGISLKPNIFQRTTREDIMIAAFKLFEGVWVGMLARELYQMCGPDIKRLMYEKFLI